MNIETVGFKFGSNILRTRLIFFLILIIHHASRKIQSDMAHLLKPSERHDEGYDEG